MGRNGVKSVTAICTPLLARVRSLQHGFTMVITGIKALEPGDNEFLKSSFNASCWAADSNASQSSALGPGDSSWVGSQTPPPYLHRLRVYSSNTDLLESIVGSVPHSWYAKDTQMINFFTLPWVVCSS
ncbi:hypothetical protein PIB30_006853 [Stylosanthes scabra]|uniref:Uncharacterized protein n=1 Tax=Stylosanthes scabra TaxID=79078 RepID=A0ABU6V393_9FABA|nr:hypothetical protein [Stylosanthes scabra]